MFINFFCHLIFQILVYFFVKITTSHLPPCTLENSKLTKCLNNQGTIFHVPHYKEFFELLCKDCSKREHLALTIVSTPDKNHNYSETDSNWIPIVIHIDEDCIVLFTDFKELECHSQWKIKI